MDVSFYNEALEGFKLESSWFLLAIQNKMSAPPISLLQVVLSVSGFK